MKSTISQDVILGALNFRHATKQFDPAQKVPQAELEVLLEAARLAPSSYGFEPWNILVIQDEKLRGKIRTASRGVWSGQLPSASHFLVFTAKTSQALEPNGAHIAHMQRDIRGRSAIAAKAYAAWFNNWRKRDFGRMEAPQLMHEWAARQAYIALANVMFAAALRGIDSCPIEGFNVEKVTKLLAERSLIDPAQDLPVVMLALGYRVDPAQPKTRRPLEEIVRVVA